MGRFKRLSDFELDEPSIPSLLEITEEPNKYDLKYRPKLNILDKIFSSLEMKKIIQADELFRLEHEEWVREKEKKELFNKEETEKYEKLMKEWEEAKDEFFLTQKNNNDAIDLEKENYLKGEPSAIVEYCDIVLSNSVYPDDFPQEFDIDFIKDTRMLVVEYVLPSIEDVPKLKEVKYIQSRDEFKEIELSQAKLNKMYDKLLYQITLRTIHELFDADEIDTVDSIVFNGWVNSIDRSTGKDVNACILSVQVMKKEFMEINLAKVEPKLYFKNLKGVGSSK